MVDKVIDCGELLTIADVGEIYAQLLEAMAEGDSVIIDCSQVNRVDTAALQMFYVYAKELKSHGHEITWNEPSQSFIDSAKLLGLSPEMNLGDN